MGPIKHVVIVVQEARSFENLFAGWPGANAPVWGQGQIAGPIQLHAMRFRDDRFVCDLAACMQLAYAGGFMNGFDLSRFTTLGNVGSLSKRSVGTFPYAYLRHSEIAPYRQLASQYVLADEMFATAWGGDFAAHQDLIAGTTFIDSSRATWDVPSSRPWGCDAPKNTTIQLMRFANVMQLRGKVFPCFDQYPTMADTLDDAGLSWKYYVSPVRGSDSSGQLWNAFDAIKRVRYGPDWKKHLLSPPAAILHDAAAGQLPAVSWVIPKLAWSDHPSQKSDKGPSWVGSIVNAIGEGPDWNSTVIVIVWSEWGGWFDDARPAFPSYLKASGLGFRVPCIIVSPYAKANMVSHTQYQFGSILKFIEETFGLRPLSSVGYGRVFTDTVSNSIGDALDFEAPPRSFIPIKTKYPTSTFAKF